MRIKKKRRGETGNGGVDLSLSHEWYRHRERIETDPDTRSQIRLFRLRILCPACGDSHEFTIGEARTDSLGASAKGNSTALRKTITSPSRYRHRVDFKPRWHFS